MSGTFLGAAGAAAPRLGPWWTWWWALTSGLVGAGLGAAAYPLRGAVVGRVVLPGPPTLVASFIAEAAAVATLAVLGGLAIGLAQWAALRRWLPGARWMRWWIPASVLGTAIGWPLGFGTAALVLLGPTSALLAPPSLIGHPMAGAVVGGCGVAVIGAVVGAGQWLVLRRHLGGAGRWVPASAFAGAVGGAVGGSVLFAVLASDSLPMPVVDPVWDALASALGGEMAWRVVVACAMGLAWAAGGGLAGVLLRRLLQGPPPTAGGRVARAG